MADDYKYLNKPISEWTETELRHAQRHPSMIRDGLHEAVDAKLDAIDANKRLVSERSKAQKREKKLLVSFADTTSKPAKSIDVRSVKHSVSDATTQKGGGAGLTIAGLAAAYDWLSGHPELVGVVKEIPQHVLIILILFGAGWWMLLFLIRLQEKWEEEH